MTLDRHLARLLAAVIVMIAASFGVSVAQAHDGHPHHHPAATATAVETAAPVVAPVAASVTDEAALRSVLTLDLEASASGAMSFLAMAAQASANNEGKTRSCDGHCCNTGMACCYTALTPAAITTGPALTLATTVVMPQHAARPSLAPEALPKPPKPFA